MESSFHKRGFLPESDPACTFQRHSELQRLDEIGARIPDRLHRSDFRKYAQQLNIPRWTEVPVATESLSELRLYYVRLGFLASAYINQVSQGPVNTLPQNIAIPLCHVCDLLNRPPILSYDGYALYNWRRLDPDGPIALGNIDTIQNFVELYDEHWFILVHVEIEAIAADILQAIDRASHVLQSSANEPGGVIDECLAQISEAVWKQVEVLRRIPEHMRPNVYYRSFRPYIRFFENVVYESVSRTPLNFRGETGAQSSIMPALIAFLKIRHEPSVLTNHLADMRRFMPADHRDLLNEIESLPPIKHIADAHPFNEVLEAIAAFREVHYQWAQQYIHQRVTDPTGTGGTPYMQWLEQLIDETRGHRKAVSTRIHR